MVPPACDMRLSLQHFVLSGAHAARDGFRHGTKTDNAREAASKS